MASKPKTHQPFEGRNPIGRFIKITEDMMNSIAWNDLSLRQQGLYLRLKSKYKEKRINGKVERSNENDISMPKSEWSMYYGNYNTFRADMEALLAHGFIKLMKTGHNSRTPNIYGFSADWKTWTTKTPIDKTTWLNWKNDRKNREDEEAYAGNEDVQ